MGKFVPLHVHTQCSLLDGSNKIKDYVARCKELGMGAAAITDHGAMYGVIDFYKECKKQEIKPVLGCEVYVAPGSRFDKKDADGIKYYHLILLAENNTGYSNLCKIVTRGFTEGFYYKPRVDKALLREYHEGLIALSACLAGEIPAHILKGDKTGAEYALKEYLDIFGRDNFFLELQDHGMTEDKQVIPEILALSKKYDIPLVATNDTHYTREEDAEAHDVLLCIQTKKKLSDENRMRYEGGCYYLKDEEEMRQLFPYAPEAIDNTSMIAERCNVELEFGVTKVPKYEVPEGYDTWTYLNKLCKDGLKERYPDDDGTIAMQLDYELSVIKKMGYVEYFLIVWDYINWAREHGIAVGPGRGSAAGSIVSYCLHITNVIDPVKYGLLFERFLNPERVSMPDIDVDFCYERRPEVIDYVKRKYGEKNVVQIITFGTMAARNVIKDVGRAMEIPYEQTNALADMIPKDVGITIAKALEQNPEFKEKYENDKTVHELIDMSMKLEGLPRQIGTHAAGVVICQKPADEFVPLAISADGTGTMAQFDMVTIEELGLLKMDFLGLKTLTVIRDAVANIKKTTGIEIDMERIDYNDKNVLDFIGTGNTDGVFQLESDGMKSFMRELKPQSLEDVIAGISLYRPGPMDFIPKYIKGKNNSANVEYECPQLEHILKPTYGCIVYQEQVMQIVRDLGGYSMGQADNIRRAMSKKKQYVIDEEREYFVHGNKERNIIGCVENGIPEDAANRIYDSMVDFAKYAFNKSHAACYAVVAMQTAFLKYYYPVEYMAALMTSVCDKPDKLTEYIQSCKKNKMKLLPPDINKSGLGFSVENGAIRFSLSAIKSVGIPSIKAIIQIRKERGEFTDYYGFLTVVKELGIDKSCVENLIKAGALDTFGGRRNQYLSTYVSVMDNLGKEIKKNVAGQMSLFSFLDEEEAQPFTMPDMPELDRDILLQYEKEATGVYISGHPLEDHMAFIQKNGNCKSTDFLADNEDSHLSNEQNVTICGLLRTKKIIYTKKNQVMAFCTLEDLYGEVELIVFPTVFEKYKDILVEDAKLVVTGAVSVEDEKNSKILVDTVSDFVSMPRNLWIRATKAEYESKESEFLALAAKYPGNNYVKIYASDVNEKKKLKVKVSFVGDMIEGTEALFGKDNVVLTI